MNDTQHTESSVLRTEHLVKKYGKRTVANDVSIEVRQGEIVGLLGPNGAGKTTTMSVITGFVAPDEGCVTINGFDMIDNPIKAKKCIGYLPEQPPLYFDMTVEEYLKFAADLKKIEKTKRRANEQCVCRCIC